MSEPVQPADREEVAALRAIVEGTARHTGEAFFRSLVRNLSASGDLEEAAANLFAMLRELDRPDFARIAVMRIPESGLGVAINDRLRRAAAPRL